MLPNMDNHRCTCLPDAPQLVHAGSVPVDQGGPLLDGVVGRALVELKLGVLLLAGFRKNLLAHLQFD